MPHVLWQLLPFPDLILSLCQKRDGCRARSRHLATLPVVAIRVPDAPNGLPWQLKDAPECLWFSLCHCEPPIYSCVRVDSSNTSVYGAGYLALRLACGRRGMTAESLR